MNNIEKLKIDIDSKVYVSKLNEYGYVTTIGVNKDGDITYEILDIEKNTYFVIEKDAQLVCPRCDGAGGFRINAYIEAGDVVEEEERDCEVCNGQGLI